MKVEKIDYTILEELAVNARASKIEIAKKLKTTEIVIRYRIKKLLAEGIILSFRPALDINILGYKYYKIYFFLRNISKEVLQQMKAFMQAKPAIAYLDETIGGADLEAELYVKGTEELYALIEGFRQKVADYLKGFEFVEYVKEHAMRYLP